MTDIASAPPTRSVGLRGSPGRHRKERLVAAILLGAALVSIIVSVLIVVSLIGGAVNFLRQISFDQLFDDGWFPRRDEFGLPTLIVGSLLVTTIALLVAVPVGPAVGHLPLRVRQSPGAADDQADPRDPGRHPERRPRLLRAHVDQPDRGPAPQPQLARLQPGGGRARRRPPDDPAHRLDLRGRDAGRAAVPARGLLRPRGAARHDDRSRSSCRPRCRASSPR